MLRVDDRIVIPESEIAVEVSRSGGPGGQNVNKVASKVQIRWNPAASASLPEPVRARLLAAVGSKLTKEGELLISSSRTRDQGRNLEDCLEKLRNLILASVKPPKVRRATKPTFGSQVRRVASKIKRSAAKKNRRAPEDD
ncbi:MAG: alternative ribosome rescue aminoacyl-tRNA hydrolase ArfB [Isosphaeraceae bacterium]|nr:alternative ribosome rescue aminoacyl-tRNA hydrolase ArfB [Isosphaeraceae bacterium]